MRYLKTIKELNESRKSNLPDISTTDIIEAYKKVSDSEISKLIHKKMSGEKLTDKEFLQLHNWLIKNDDDYCKLVDKQGKKDLKRYLPKGTKIE
jgi:uncharacterized protein YydD (DUF2326 family)